MLNLYDFVVQNDQYKKFEVDDFLFVEYKCHFPDYKAAYLSSSNYFLFVLGGKKKWTTEKNEYLVKEGEGIFVKRGVYTAQRFYDDEFCALLIFVPDNFIESTVRKYVSIRSDAKSEPTESDSIFRLSNDSAILTYFQSLLSYFSQSNNPPKELLLIKFEELILNILSSPQNEELGNYFRGLRNNKVSVREVMEKYFMHNLSIEEYARLSARSISTFKVDFQNEYNTSPGRWLTVKRLGYAKLLIESTHESINEIALKSGFKNISHFVRVFKMAYGKPPLQHRQVLMEEG